MLKGIVIGISTYFLSSAFNFALSQYKSSYPEKHWETVSSPEVLGFSSSRLSRAKAYSDSLKTSALMVVVHGKIVTQWGDIAKKLNTHSIRKSFLSAMFGKYVKNGTIDLDETMNDLGISDVGGLSENELKATIRDCLKARSGVYHDALYETAGMKALKPERYSELPGTHWYYNNWDFNVLGTIFHQKTHKDFYQEIYDQIASPIGMEDYEVSDGQYISGDESIHNAYPFRISARDLARFGLLMLNRGKWKNRQIIDSDWVDESTRYHSDATLYRCDGYGYLWWVSRKFNKYSHLPGTDLPEGTYSARGARGHFLLIIPKYDMIIVHRVNTDITDNVVDHAEFGKLVRLILDAREDNREPRSN